MRTRVIERAVRSGVEGKHRRRCLLRLDKHLLPYNDHLRIRRSRIYYKGWVGGGRVVCVCARVCEGEQTRVGSFLYRLLNIQ